jgi:membrane protein implicated in regulation of membrane protease activity
VSRRRTGRRPLPARPFRDTAIFYGVLAVCGFGFLLLTGQNATKSAFGALAAFVLATSWSWWRFARAQAEEERNQ